MGVGLGAASVVVAVLRPLAITVALLSLAVFSARWLGRRFRVSESRSRETRSG
jgi:hypothetical protein